MADDLVREYAFPQALADMQKTMREAAPPWWNRRVIGTPLENDIPVRAATLMMKKLLERDAQLAAMTAKYVAELNAGGQLADLFTKKCDELRAMTAERETVQERCTDYHDMVRDLQAQLTASEAARKHKDDCVRLAVAALVDGMDEEAAVALLAKALAAPGKAEPFKVFANGPACPTCGFSIRTYEREPFVIEEAEPGKAAPPPKDESGA